MLRVEDEEHEEARIDSQDTDSEQGKGQMEYPLPGQSDPRRITGPWPDRQALVFVAIEPAARSSEENCRIIQGTD